LAHRSIRSILLWIAGLLLLVAVLLLFFGRERTEVRLLYATAEERAFDTSAFYQFEQSLIANLAMESAPLERMSKHDLSTYDAIYLDISLSNTKALQDKLNTLRQYVEDGGHLLVEQELFEDLPLDLLGATAIGDIPSTDQPSFEYPEVAPNLEGIQEVYRRFADNFVKHIGMGSMPDFKWGKHLVASTANTVVSMNGVPLLSVNRLGEGTVTAAGGFLPNRYFITSFDLLGGMDPNQGFASLIRAQSEKPRPAGAAYFDRGRIPLEPYFHFAFSSANYLLRSEYVTFISKEQLGYAVKKTLGPYGRPAMAYQNHFEALAAFRDREGIQWAELLKQRNQLPSFSLVRSAFEWWTWQETVTVHLNEGNGQKPRFSGELAHSYYGSGTHLLTDGKPLTQAVYPERLTLSEPLKLPYRAAPALGDLNGDARADLVTGSADGYVYVYLNEGSGQNADSHQLLPEGLAAPDQYGRAQQLMLTTGKPVQVGAYSTVALIDSNADGKLDLVIGNKDGAVMLLTGQGELRFAPPVELRDADRRAIRVASYASPAFGDMDGDGLIDLIVGDGTGAVHMYRGQTDTGTMYSKGQELVRLNALYAAPSVRDMNGDGRADMVVGNSEGDLLLYIQSGTGWSSMGPIEGTTRNQIGNQALVGGHNSVPFWYDINHDGHDDLIVGQVEYGPAIPLDSPGFPYPKQLAEFIEYSRLNHLELYPHLYFHNYVSSEQEKQEIELHRQSFARLGIPWKETGTNQHTWRINNADRLQTLSNEHAANLWFNFGFKPSHAPTDPQWGPDYIWGVPFLLRGPGVDLSNPMLLYTPAPTLRIGGDYSSEDIYDSFVALDLPITYFEHIEYHFPDRIAELTQFVDYFDRIRTEHDYNFMSEPQMARSFLATLAGKVEVSRTWGRMALDYVKDLLGDGRHLTLDIRSDTSAVPAQAAEYRDTLGVVIEPGEQYLEHPLGTDADLFLKRDKQLYLGLNRPVTVNISWAAEPMHLIRANVPVNIDKKDAHWTIEAQSAGMQQLKLYSPEPVNVEGPELRVDYDEPSSTYTITHFGEPVTITVSPVK
jgi:hypothetical protein